MTVEYKGEHPRIPPVKIRRRRGSKASDPEEKIEEKPIVAELRAAVAKEELKDAQPPPDDTRILTS